ASAMGFNRRKMEDQRREAAEKEAATRRATDAQVLADAERLDRRLERAPSHQRTHDLFADDRHRHQGGLLVSCGCAVRLAERSMQSICGHSIVRGQGGGKPALAHTNKPLTRVSKIIPMFLR